MHHVTAATPTSLTWATPVLPCSHLEADHNEDDEQDRYDDVRDDADKCGYNFGHS